MTDAAMGHPTTGDAGARAPEPLLQVRRLQKTFPIRNSNQVVHACSDVSLTLRAGETLGVIGESGSGKTTLGRCILRLVEPTAGEVIFNGSDLVGLRGSNLRRLRRDLQIVFQEPFDSLSPQMVIGRQIVEPLRIHTNMSRAERKAKAKELLRLVGLSAETADKLPAALTPGQMQRASIARAIATEPKLIILDEPTSALSPEAEVETIDLLESLQERLGLTYIFISHDLSLVRSICDHVAVMYLSQIVESGARDEVFSNPRHPYSKALLSSVLLPYVDAHRADRRGTRLEGEIPSPIDLPEGCFLASRCPHVTEPCRGEPQQLEPTVEADHLVRCRRVINNEI